MAAKAQKAIDAQLQLETQNVKCKKQLSTNVKYLQNELQSCQNKLGIVKKALADQSTHLQSYKNVLKKQRW